MLLNGFSQGWPHLVLCVTNQAVEEYVSLSVKGASICLRIDMFVSTGVCAMPVAWAHMLANIAPLISCTFIIKHAVSVGFLKVSLVQKGTKGTVVLSRADCADCYCISSWKEKSPVPFSSSLKKLHI